MATSLAQNGIWLSLRMIVRFCFWWHWLSPARYMNRETGSRSSKSTGLSRGPTRPSKATSVPGSFM